MIVEVQVFVCDKDLPIGNKAFYATNLQESW